MLLDSAALLSGAMAATVAFLLYRQKGYPLFRDFGGMVVGLGWYGTCDQAVTLSGTRDSLAVLAVVGLGIAAGFALQFLIRLGGVRPGRWLRWVAWFPAVFAGLLGGGMLVTQAPPDRTVGLALLGLDLVWLVGGLTFALLRRKTIHDRETRRLVLATGILVLAFLPLWGLQTAGILDLPTFSLFYLCWNVGALVVAAQSWFRPESPREGETLPPEALETLAERFGLTAREKEVAVLHLTGRSAQELADQLFISPKTVRNHLTSIYHKTGMNTRFTLLRLAKSLTGAPIAAILPTHRR